MKIIHSTRGGRPDYGLTPREQEVLTLAAQGLNRPQIAEQLGLQPLTIGSHMKKIHRKLGVHSRAAAVAMVLKLGLLEGGLKPALSVSRKGAWRGKLAPSGGDCCPNCGCNFAAGGRIWSLPRHLAT